MTDIALYTIFGWIAVIFRPRINIGSYRSRVELQVFKVITDGYFFTSLYIKSIYPKIFLTTIRKLLVTFTFS